MCSKTHGTGSPRESRLVHGVGFISLGALMDEIAEGIAGCTRSDAQTCLLRTLR